MISERRKSIVKAPPLLSVIIPVYNERDTILPLLRRVLDVPIDKEIIVIDNFSTDGTREILQSLPREIKVLLNPCNLGKGASVRKGVDKAQGEYVLIQDADLEYSPEEYPLLLQPMLERKADAVFGSRVLGKNSLPFGRYFIGGRALSFLASVLYQRKLTDVGTCYFVETGFETNTGGRIKRLEPFLEVERAACPFKHLAKGSLRESSEQAGSMLYNEEVFFVTYADGLAEIDLKKLLAFHLKNAKISTLTAVQPTCPFGVLEIGENHIVKSFTEKPKLSLWVNGGFFVFNKAIFRILSENAVLEGEVFEKLASLGQLVAYPHEGFWACMDTQKDLLTLQEMWQKHQAPWKVW